MAQAQVQAQSSSAGHHLAGTVWMALAVSVMVPSRLVKRYAADGYVKASEGHSEGKTRMVKIEDRARVSRRRVAAMARKGYVKAGPRIDASAFV